MNRQKFVVLAADVAQRAEFGDQCAHPTARHGTVKTCAAANPLSKTTCIAHNAPSI